LPIRKRGERRGACLVEIIGEDALAASLQPIACLPLSPPGLFPIEPLLEFDQSEHSIRFPVVVEPIVQRDGWVAIPDRPGIGVEINRATIAHFTAA
jgi:D-galactarolactone cycloisomerase